MRIVERTDSTLRMRGVPGGAAWMAAFLAFGLVIVALSVWLLVGAVRTQSWLDAVFLLLGVALGALLAGVGATRLLTRESLTLDRARGEGVHETRYLVGAGARVRRFRLDAADHARLSRREQHTRHRDAETDLERSTRSIVWRAELMVADPRDRILLAETQNDAEAPVREAAVAVAEFLGLPLVEDIDEEAETIDAEDVGRPIADRAAPGVPQIDDPPPGSRIAIAIDPDAQTVTLSWKALGNGCLAYAGLIVALGWTGVSLFFLLAVLGVIPGAGVAPGQSVALLAAACGAFVLIGLALLAAMVYLLLGARRTVVITPTELRARAPLGVQSATLPLGEITSVRTSKSDDAVLVSAGERRARLGVHLPAEGELTWLGAAVRAAIRAMKP